MTESKTQAEPIDEDKITRLTEFIKTSSNLKGQSFVNDIVLYTFLSISLLTARVIWKFNVFVVDVPCYNLQ